MNKKRKQVNYEKNKWLFIIILLFTFSAIIRGFLSDFPKALRIYPDELRYLSIAKSLFQGKGLQLHNMASDFQKVLYSICIMPAFLFKSSEMQIRAIGYINSVIISCSIFPVYGLCRKLLKNEKESGFILAFWITLPTLLNSMYFMSEVTFLPLSLGVIYCVWCIMCTEKFTRRLQLNLLLGILCYLAYLNKEIAIYFFLAYLFARAGELFVHRSEILKEIICLVVFIGTFMFCFLLMKLTLFQGLSNSYSNYNLYNLQKLGYLLQPEKVIYLLYSIAYDTVFAVLAFGVFPIIIPIALFEKKEKESWFFLFLLVAFLIGCATIAYTITLPEELGKRSPRQHLRYLEPLVIPFYILMINCIRKLKNLERSGKYRIRFKVATIGMVLFATAFLMIGAGGGSALVDNCMLIYYEFFARFLCKSDTILLVVRIVMALVLGIGLLLLYQKKYALFIRMFSIVFIGLNLINSVAGYSAGLYRYTIDEEKRTQASEANDYLWSLTGNVLLLSEEGWESEDNRLFDTYVSRDFYVADIDMIEADGFLEDSVLDLQSEFIRCDFPYSYYSDLKYIDYLVVKDEYDIRMKESSVEKIMDFPLEGYSLYQNREPDRICFEK